MAQHAFLSASSAHRWSMCTAAPHYEAQFPDKDPGVYANEGTLAHKICELTVQYNAGQITKRKYNSQLRKCQNEELYSEEMLRTAEFYAEHIWQASMAYKSKPYIATEVRVDFSEIVPEGFGTCDCCMIGDSRLSIFDYKHGKGVQVSAENNPQMRLYALGALRQYSMFYQIETVSVSIIQPRITEDVSCEEISVEDLIKWGEQLKPIAQKAYSGEGAEFKEGPWCRFCKGRAVCRARAGNATALEDFMSMPIIGKMTDEEKMQRTSAEIAGFPVSHVLSDKEVGDLLERGARLVQWYDDLKAYAQEALLAGKEIPGWKVVEGRATRQWDDPEAALEEFKKAGFDEAVLFDRKAKSLSELEKMVGKKRFAEIAGEHILRPPGKPTLVVESDKRQPYSAAAADFKNIKE